MSKSKTFENEFLLNIFNNVAMAGIGDVNGIQPSATAGVLFLSLHTADPGETGTQATNEISYTGYARQSVVRGAAGFTVSGSTVTLAANQDFPEMTGGTGGTVTFFAVGKSVSGATNMLYSGSVTPTIAVALGVTPRLKLTTSVTEN
jgi:hypothetical protein